MGMRGPKPKGMVDCTWRRELAYCVGLLVSDGCLSGDGRHIDLTSLDREQIEHFQSALGLVHVKVGRKSSGSTEGNKYYRIQFGDVLFYQWLQSIGLSPAKSKTIGAVRVPNEFFADFLRGVFDGDGSTYSYWDLRWKSSFMYYLEFTSASPVFVAWLRARNEAMWGVRGSVVTTGRGSAFILRYAKREGKVLLDAMYADAGTLKLGRKFAKVQKMVTIDNAHRFT